MTPVRRHAFDVCPKSAGLAEISTDPVSARAALRNRPWDQSTGPRTPLGKKIVSQNHLVHGLFSKADRKTRAAYVAHCRQVREMAAGGRPTTPPPLPG